MWSYTMEVMKHIFVSMANTWQAMCKFKLLDLITENGELVHIHQGSTIPRHQFTMALR
jgi:hypothetical protein